MITKSIVSYERPTSLDVFNYHVPQLITNVIHEVAEHSAHPWDVAAVSGDEVDNHIASCS